MALTLLLLLLPLCTEDDLFGGKSINLVLMLPK